MSRSPDEIRETLLNSARQAGERYLQVRGVDLLIAIAGKAENQQLPAKSPSDKKDR